MVRCGEVLVNKLSLPNNHLNHWKVTSGNGAITRVSENKGKVPEIIYFACEGDFPNSQKLRELYLKYLFDAITVFGAISESKMS